MAPPLGGEPPTPETEQFAAINQPDYFNVLKAKVNAIKDALTSVEGRASEIETVIDGVPLTVSFVSQNEGRLKLGVKQDGTPLYDWTFPIRWLEEVAP